MKMLIDEHSEIEVKDFCGLPIVGELPGCASVILANWEGHACRVMTKKNYPGKARLLESIYASHPHYFDSGDKGALSLYGCDMFGNVIFGCCIYSGDESSKNPLERVKHLFVKKCNSVNGFNHY